MHRRTLLAVAVFALSIVIVTSTGSFTSASVERGASVAIVEDENGYFGIDANHLDLEQGNHKDVKLLTITNNLDSSVECEYEATPNKNPPPVVQNIWSDNKIIEADETMAIYADVTCGKAKQNEAAVPIQLHFSTDDVTSHMNRSVTIKCPDNPGNDESNETTTTGSPANNSTDASTIAPPTVRY